MKQTAGSRQKKQIITIAGRPGSGKSTTAKEVASNLGFKHFSSGDLFRQLGSQRGIELLRANRSQKDSDIIDSLVDSRLREIGANENFIVIDSRTAWYWIPDSFKVFLDLDLESASRRILAEMNESRQASEEVNADPAEYAKVLQTRLDSESQRYKLKYDIDPYDMANYDLIIDTSANDAKQTVKIVLENFRNWIKPKNTTE